MHRPAAARAYVLSFQRSEQLEVSDFHAPDLFSVCKQVLEKHPCGTTQPLACAADGAPLPLGN
jgi:hypothetical protein